MNIRALLPFALLATSGCSTMYHAGGVGLDDFNTTSAKYDKVSTGMTRGEVLTLLGPALKDERYDRLQATVVSDFHSKFQATPGGGVCSWQVHYGEGDEASIEVRFDTAGKVEIVEKKTVHRTYYNAL
jgi:outer membrane protein assembly factor BamE (lipoprotein component of BamABCDE complex)